MKGQVYLIESNGLKYVGSTKQTIYDRFRKHDCWSLYDMNKDDYSYKILEEVEYNEKYELRMREQYYIETIDCCNKQNAYLGKNKKDADKEYYERNKERLIEKACEYQKTDKAKLNAKKRYQNNKEKVKQYSKDNRKRINEKRKELRDRKITWGGDPRNSNNLLQIDCDIFS